MEKRQRGKASCGGIKQAGLTAAGRGGDQYGDEADDPVGSAEAGDSDTERIHSTRNPIRRQERKDKRPSSQQQREMREENEHSCAGELLERERVNERERTG